MTVFRVIFLQLMVAAALAIVTLPSGRALAVARPPLTAIMSTPAATPTPTSSPMPTASPTPTPPCAAKDPKACLDAPSGHLSSLFALVFLVVLYALYAIITGHANPLWIAMGTDGRLSSSKLQFLTWTVVVIYAYIGLAIDRFGLVAGAGMPPTNVLIAMGLSLTTAAAAKGIIVGYQNAGQAVMNQRSPTMALRYLIMSDDGVTPDLPKIQMLAWTAVAVVVFLLDLFAHYTDYATCAIVVNGTTMCFPDIDTALMVLMALGQGAYLGFKLVPSGPSGQPTQPSADIAVPTDPDIPLHPGGDNQSPLATAGLGADIAP